MSIKVIWTEEKSEEAGKYLYRFNEESPVVLLQLYFEYNAPGAPLTALNYYYEVKDLVGQWSELIE